MIYHCYYAGFPTDTLNVAKFGKPPVYISPWEVLRNQLEASHDTFVWIVTRKQLKGFLSQIKDHDLEKFCVVKHDEVVPVDGYYKVMKDHTETMGVSNYNYQNDPRKLKLFIMKGAKAK